MTKTEAAEVLNRARPILATEELKTAIDMAIEALKDKEDEPQFYTEDDYWNGMFTESAEAYKAWTGEVMGGTSDLTVQDNRPHGEWIVREYCTNELDYRRWIEIECPFCGEKPTYEDLDYMNYCPNCGAIMTPYKGGDTK